MKNIMKFIGLYGILFLGSILMILPFYWMLATSLKSGGEAIQVPPTWLPENWLFSNYSKALEAAPFARYFINSVIVTFTSTAGELFTSILAAFAFSIASASPGLIAGSVPLRAAMAIILPIRVNTAPRFASTIAF